MFEQPLCPACHRSMEIASEWSNLCASRLPFIFNCYGIRCNNCHTMLAIRPQRYNFALCLAFAAAITFILSLDKLIPQIKGATEEVDLLQLSLFLLLFGSFLLLTSKLLARLLRLDFPTDSERDSYKPVGWERKGLLLNDAGKIQVNVDQFYIHGADYKKEKDWVCPQCGAKGSLESQDLCNQCGWRQIWQSDLE